MIDIDGDPLEIAITRSSDWFKIHAEQRLKLFNFYVIILIGLVAGYSAALKENITLIEFMAPIILLLVTYAFKNLDKRSAGLVKIAEQALQEIDAAVAERCGCAEFNIIGAAERKDGVPSYRQSFNLIFVLGGLFGAIGLGFAIWRAICGSTM